MLTLQRAIYNWYQFNRGHQFINMITSMIWSHQYDSITVKFHEMIISQRYVTNSLTYSFHEQFLFYPHPNQTIRTIDRRRSIRTFSACSPNNFPLKTTSIELVGHGKIYFQQVGLIIDWHFDQLQVTQYIDRLADWLLEKPITKLETNLKGIKINMRG